MIKRPPYYVVRNGRAFFQLGKKRAEQSGMHASYPLGAAGLKAMQSASDLYWQYCRAVMLPAPKPVKPYRKGTLAHWYAKFQEKPRYTRLGSGTRADYEFAWRTYIEPALGDKKLSAITPSVFETFFLDMERDHGAHARWKAVKISRAIFNAAVAYDVLQKSPCKTLANTQPKSRHQFWYAHEINRLVAVALENEYVAMSLGIRLAWETLMSPVDVRTLTRSHFRRDATGGYVKTARAKTGALVYSAISDALWDDIEAYIESLPFILADDAPILRTTRSGAAYRKARFGDEFALVRKLAFGPDEKRQMRDIRRSGNLEADLGGADASERSVILANAMDRDSTLDETYTPATVTKSREVLKKREAGRRALRAESLKAEQSGLKVRGK